MCFEEELSVKEGSAKYPLAEFGFSAKPANSATKHWLGRYNSTVIHEFVSNCILKWLMVAKLAKVCATFLYVLQMSLKY